VRRGSRAAVFRPDLLADRGRAGSGVPGVHGEQSIPAAAEPTLAERLRELADLHKDGILSDDEFAAAKAKLLAGL
jgi:hypothetical protein